MGFGAEFLRTPDLFPARFAGPTAGDRELVVDVAGGPYRFGGLSAIQEAALRSRYGALLIEPATDAAVDIEVYEVDAGEFLPRTLDGRLNRYDFEYTENSVAIAGNQVMARLCWRSDARAAIWSCLEEGPEFLEAIENCFRSIVAYRLLACGGAALHSSALLDGSAAWVFYGHSGAGKTTLARRGHVAGHAVLSDDLNAILLEDSVPHVAKLPFAGDFGQSAERAGPFPLAGLARLEKASDPSWKPLSPAASVAAMAACAPFLNTDPYRLPHLLDNLESLARSVSTGTLRVTLTHEFWPLLREAT